MRLRLGLRVRRPAGACGDKSHMQTRAASCDTVSGAVSESRAEYLQSDAMTQNRARKFLWLLLFMAWGLVGLAKPTAAQRVLALVDRQGVQTSHAAFFADLQHLGLEVEIKNIDADDLKLQSWGHWLYDGVLILSDDPSKGLGGVLSPAAMLKFLDEGGCIFIAAGAGAHSSVRSVASDLGADFIAPGIVLRDHISHAQGEGPESVVTRSVAAVAPVTGNVAGPILFRGTALTVAPDATLSTAVLNPEPTAVAASSSANLLTGPQLALAVAMQTRSDARAIVLASLDALSDAAFEAHVAADSAVPVRNRELAQHLAAWAFRLSGVVRVSALRHSRVGEDAPPALSTYTVEDLIAISVDMEERQLGVWGPHEGAAVQAQFVMLGPYIRETMRESGGGRYALEVQAPDRYGVFKWVLDYKAPGYTFVHIEEVTPLRPQRHDEYPRLIPQAYPYYATLGCLSIAFMVVITFAMYHK